MEKKILLVEDDQFLRELNLETLQSGGYSVTVAVDGEDALQQLKSGVFSLVLVDILIPKMNGVEVIKKFKADGGEIHCPVVFLTNMDDSREVQEAKTVGNGVLIKSEMTPPQLLEKVNEYLTPSN